MAVALKPFFESADGLKVRGSELTMAAVTKRRLGRMFAAAKEQFFVGLRGVFDRFKGTSLVGPIAKRLLAGFATGAPKVGFALGYIDGKGCFLGDIGGVGHGLGGSLAAAVSDTVRENR